MNVIFRIKQLSEGHGIQVSCSVSLKTASNQQFMNFLKWKLHSDDCLIPVFLSFCVITFGTHLYVKAIVHHSSSTCERQVLWSKMPLCPS